MITKSRPTLACLLLGCCLPVLSAQAAIDAFLQFTAGPNAPVTEGEVQDSDFSKAVQLRSFSLGVENSVALASGTTGKAKLVELNIGKLVDTASPPLFQVCAAGLHYDTVKLSVRRSEMAGAFLVYTFKNVYVQSVSWAGSSGDEKPGETVKLAYAAVKIEYYSGERTNGSIPVTQSWNQVLNSSEFEVKISL